MADPRSAVDLQGIDLEIVTYKIDNSTITYDGTKANGAAATMIGKAVSLSAAATVQLISDGEAVEGKLLSVTDDNFCTVQVGGFCDLPGGSGASLTRGKKIVGALGAASAKGYIREVATATAAELGVARGRIIDAGTTTAVIVDLD
jgi:hypothetical protein